MPYTLSTIDEGHIILIALTGSLETEEVMRYFQECYNLVENGPDRIVIITDTTAAPLKSIDDLIQGANTLRTPEAKQLNNHPKVIKALTVVNNKAVNLAIKGLNSAMFGFIEMPIFATQEEAISHARAVLSSQS